MTQSNFDLIVIGTGSAGASTAKKCAKEGKKVAIIDSRPYGGTCPLRGCDPKKVLVGAADIVDQQQRMHGKGVASKAEINWANLMQFKRTFTEPIPGATVDDMQELGISCYHGQAKFINEQTLRVNEDQLKAEKILIAAGNKPAPLPINGSEHLATSTNFLALEALPDSILFVGGGYISFEFAHVAVRAGASVRIVHQKKEPLESFDQDLVDVLVERSKNLGISIELNTAVQSVEKSDRGFIVSAQHNNETKQFSADLVVHGGGRVPRIEALDLEKANINHTKKGIAVNEYLQSESNARVYTAGDAADTKGLPLTPLAGFESSIVTENILHTNRKKAAYPAQPTAVFTIPPMAAVGLTENEARDSDRQIEVHFQQTDDWYSSRRTNETGTAYKTIIDKKSGEIIGAHIIGQHAPELINLFTVAINEHIAGNRLKNMLFAYPTHSSNIPAMV